MLDDAIKVNAFLMGYTKTLTGDIADARMAEQPMSGINHPAWVLGHLALTADNVAGRFGSQKTLPAEWGTLFGAGSKPTSTRTDYPTKDKLFEAFEQTYRKLRELVQNVKPDQLAQPNWNPRAKEVLPTAGDMVAFILTGHVGVHLGQLSSWRRMIGMPPLF
jgi:hypothetical protein